MESMTGYSFLERSTEMFSFSVELKSLNARYFETYINLPKILRNEENELINLLKEFFSRGKLELTIDIFDWVEAKPVSINRDLLKKYYHELKHVHESLGVEEPLKFESILLLDGISQKERSVISEKSRRDIYNAVAIVIKKALEMRGKEGNATKKDIIYFISEISKSIKNIKFLSKDVTKKKKDILRKRIESLSGSELDDVRLYSELAILADKLDINEEVVRLNDHLNKLKSLMKGEVQVGKKLDFLAQEMFREINTIGSKSNSSEISHIVVDIKNNIDKIREHCRNIV